MMTLTVWLVALMLTVAEVLCGDHMVHSDINLKETGRLKDSKSPEDSIPVIEIRGEGKPMTAAQIRALEEEAEGKPLDIKVKNTWIPADCPHKAHRKDFVTFQYKVFLEDGKKVDQSYKRGPVRMQLGVGMTLPGLDKGLKGMCDTELRKIQIPWRLSRKKRGKVWKYVPTEEHWLTFDIEMLSVEPWTADLQFHYMDANNDSFLTQAEVSRHTEKLHKEFGKVWPNDEIDNVMAAKYFVRYYDQNGDGKVSIQEYRVKVAEDEQKIKSARGKKPQGRRRDPGVMGILDFNLDGIVTRQETDSAPEIFENTGGKIEEILEKNKNKDEL